MKKALYFFSLTILLASCKNENREDDQKASDSTKSKELVDQQANNLTIKDRLTTKDGIKISWLKHGGGAKVNDGDVVDIRFKVSLENGTVIESSDKLNRPFPFLVGYQMQTTGWDKALAELKVGDMVKIFLPAKEARGEKGIKDLIPPNSNNLLEIEVLEKRNPTRNIEGVKVWVIDENKKNKSVFNEKNSISFHTMTGTKTNPRYFNSFRENKAFELKLADAGVAPGLKMALEGAKKADRMYILVPSEFGYGHKGLTNLVEPNQSLFYNVYVMDVF
jgi:FKBP-type peptidyl-prolyl cis-trans isomerase